MARKAKLPFLVQPKRQPIIEKIGSEEIGTIEICRRGYLTVAEKSFMQQSQGGDTAIVGMHRLASKVARETGRPVTEITEMVAQGDFSDAGFEPHREELEELVASLSAIEARTKLIAVTCLVLYRCSDEWTVENTLELHPDLVDELYMLYLEEDQRSLEAFEAIKDSTAAPKTEGK